MREQIWETIQDTTMRAKMTGLCQDIDYLKYVTSNVWWGWLMIKVPLWLQRFLQLPLGYTYGRCSCQRWRWRHWWWLGNNNEDDLRRTHLPQFAKPGWGPKHRLLRLLQKPHMSWHCFSWWVYSKNWYPSTGRYSECWYLYKLRSWIDRIIPYLSLFYFEYTFWYL